jgi:hypothetical protein
VKIKQTCKKSLPFGVFFGTTKSYISIIENNIKEPGLKSIFVPKLCVVLNFCILINNELTPVQKI